MPITHREGKAVGWGQKRQDWREEHPIETLSWRSTCQCNAGDPIPATVLDPFLGSGSTAIAALRLGRNAVGIDLSPEYIKMAAERIKADSPMLNEVVMMDNPATAGGHLCREHE